MDGNYHFNMKPRETDQNDVAMSKNASYFVNHEDFGYFIKKAPRPAKEVECYSLLYSCNV